MDSSPKTYRCPLITGASSGLGEEFARQLAPHCDGLLLVARRGERLREIGQELQSNHPGLQIWFFVADLTSAEQRNRLLEAIEDKGIVPDLLVNNAGMGDYSEFDSADWSKLEAMIQLNIAALTHLTHALMPALKETRGGIINVSSLASIMPLPDFAVYAATKAYVTSFSEALRSELKGCGVTVTVLCPGPIATEFGATAARFQDQEIPRSEWMKITKEEAVSQALVGYERKKARVYPGWTVAITAAVVATIPFFLLRYALDARPLSVGPSTRQSTE